MAMVWRLAEVERAASVASESVEVLNIDDNWEPAARE